MKMTESMELLQIQLANHKSKIEEVYGEVMERATNYRDTATANISTVYQSQFGVLNVQLNQCMAMQQKIAQVTEHVVYRGKHSLFFILNL